MSYPSERKEAILRKMLPPNNKTIKEIAEEEGISEATLYNWRKAARADGRLLPDGDTTPAGWSASDKFAAVVETAALNEVQLSTYCRERGLYPEQLQQWRGSSASCAKKRRRWRKPPRCWCCEKKPARLAGGRRGRMISAPDRQQAVALIDEAVCGGARAQRACEELGLCLRTYQRWQGERGVKTDGRPQAVRPAPANKLSPHERQEILDVCNQAPYSSLPPSQIVPALADQGRYIASEASFYRVLRDADQVHHRGKARAPRTVSKPTGYRATGPNQVWSWDITYLATTVVGLFFRLYLVMDIYSRKIVGWEVHETETAEHAALLIRKACLAEGVCEAGLVLHADNGSPMKGATMLATLQRLGIVPSFSRPSVSNDNPFSESLFGTLKYTPAFPSKPFDSLTEAREWVAALEDWYNERHHHSAIRFVTPAARHSGEEEAILAQRRAIYEAAKQRHPERWSGSIRNWTPVGPVCLNPDTPETGIPEIRDVTA